MNERTAIRRMIRGQEAAARRQLQLLAETGPEPERSIEVAFGLIDLAADMGLWQEPRDIVSQRAIEQVRRRWLRIERRARGQR